MTETVTEQKGHPKGLGLLFFTEMWERFSYYGMRAIFTLYMVNALIFDKAFASKIYGSYTGLVYLTPLLGGYIADRYWGNRRSIIFGGLLMAVGQFFMFLSGSTYQDPESSRLFMFTGLGFLIFGNGFFKPNISTMVGQLYPKGDRRVDSAFTIFYMGINLGAMIAPVVCGSLGEQYDVTGNIIPSSFKWGFLAACIGMIISLITFILLKNKYVVTPEGEAVGMAPSYYKNKATSVNTEMDDTPLGGEVKSGIGMGKIVAAIAGLVGLYLLFNMVLGFDETGAAIFSACLVLPAVIITEPSLTKIEKDRILVIYVIAFFVIFFWSAFEQAGASLTFFAQEQTDRMIFGWNMPASLFQIFNAAFIVILAPVAVWLWGVLGKRNMEPASPVKQSIGLAFLALGYLYIAWGVKGAQPWDKFGMVWLVGLYLLHTIGELCLSPIGLSMVVKLAPARFVSLLMGVWFMSTATANKFAGDLSALYPEDVKLSAALAVDSNAVKSIQAQTIDSSNAWGLSAKENISMMTVAATDNSDDKKVKDKDKKILSFQVDTTAKATSVSVYHLKLIRTVNSKMKHAMVSPDGNFLYVLKTEKVKKRDEKGNAIEETKNKMEKWNLKPKKPSFLGMQINTLFDFFMIFVYMAGAASLVLFLIHKWLLNRMHGVR